MKHILFFIYIIYSTSSFAGGGHGHEDEKEDHGEEDGLVRISDVGMEVSNIEVKPLKKANMLLSFDVNGYVVTNEYQTSHLKPRYPGIVIEVFVGLGDKVKKNQKLAIVQANGSETNFKIISSFSGTITEKNIVKGQFVSVDHSMFTVSNLDEVWVHLSIPEHHIKQVKKGQVARIWDWTEKNTIQGKIQYISSTIYKDSQSIMARVEIPNIEGNWRPGLFIKAKIFIDSIPNALTVEKSSIQTLNGNQVVFLEKEEGAFLPQVISLGRRNSQAVEVVSGLKDGDRYVSKNSYILKADFLKSEASHEH